MSMHASPDPEDECYRSFDPTSQLSAQLDHTTLSKPQALPALPAVLANSGATVSQAAGVWTVVVAVPDSARQ